MKRFWPPALVLVLIVLTGTSCLKRIKKPFRESGERAESTASQMTGADSSAAADARQHEATIRKLESRIQTQRLRVLEKETVIVRQQQQLAAQRQTLDDVIAEVVKAKAKHATPQERARAASESAEAEIALGSLRRALGDASHPALVQAERLMAMSGQEFEKRNFGGALFLTNQAKSSIRAGMAELSEPEPRAAMDGETAFALPLSLSLSKNSNLREGPGQQFPVLDTLNKGSAVIGYSSKGPWLRVKSEDGTAGWIHQSLLDAG